MKTDITFEITTVEDGKEKKYNVGIVAVLITRHNGGMWTDVCKVGENKFHFIGKLSKNGFPLPTDVSCVVSNENGKHIGKVKTLRCEGVENPNRKL